MHVLFLTDNFPPEVNAPASRTFEHCREWVKMGHKVTVITCAPNFPQGKVYGGYRNQLWQREEMDGIRVIRVWSYITANEGFAKRILDYQSFMVSATVASLFVRRVDVVIGTSPQFFTVCSAWIVSLLKRAPFVFELRDLWPESIKAVGAMGESPAIRALERLEMLLYRRAAAIVSVTEAFKRSLVARGIEAAKIHVVTNGVDLSRFSPRPRDAELERSLGLQGKFVAGYIGTHGMAHALDTLLDAAAQLQVRDKEDRFRILFLGNGSAKQALVDRADEMGLRNVLFIDSVPKDDVVRYWSLLNASIIHLRNTHLFTTVIPSKLFESLGMGIPVLLGVKGEAVDILNRTGGGSAFEPENASELSQQIRGLASSSRRYAEYSHSGALKAKLFDRAALAGDMLNILASVVNTPLAQPPDASASPAVDPPAEEKATPPVPIRTARLSENNNQNVSRAFLRPATDSLANPQESSLERARRNEIERFGPISVTENANSGNVVGEQPNDEMPVAFPKRPSLTY